MGYFKVLRMAKIKGAGLYFLCNHSECARFWIAVLSLQSGGPFLAECLSGFPAFAENDGKGNGNDGRGCLPCTIVTLAGPFLYFVFQERLGREAQEVLSGSTM